MTQTSNNNIVKINTVILKQIGDYCLKTSKYSKKQRKLNLIGVEICKS